MFEVQPQLSVVQRCGERLVTIYWCCIAACSGIAESKAVAIGLYNPKRAEISAAGGCGLELIVFSIFLPILTLSVLDTIQSTFAELC